MLIMRWSCVMRKKLALIVAVVLVTVLGLVAGLLLKRDASDGEDDLINISELSEDFMDNYFAEYRDLGSDEAKENVLIVTSLGGVADSYGAAKVVVAPNHQYILQYESEDRKNEAKEKFKSDENIAAVDDNDVITLDVVTYNSWGVEKMALDGAIEVANAKDLPKVKVAVIDSGCDVELVNKYYPGKIVETYDVLGKSDTSMQDSYGHGTHVTGIIAESVPENVGIVPVKVTDGRTMRVADVIAAINYVVRDRKVDVINMSFGLYTNNVALYNAIEAANQEKVVVVAAAGNDNTAQNAYPAAFDNTISIASVDSELKKSAFSNYNATVDFAAPGTGIKSTLRSSMAIPQAADGDDDFGVLSGTSMAAPHVASVAAVLKSYNKELTKDEVVGLLRDYATKDLGEVGKDVYYGNGLVYLRPESFCGDVEEDDCEEFGVFKAGSKISVVGIAVQNGFLTDRDYGTVNNLNPTQVEVTYSDGVALMANLGDLSGVRISGYDPDASVQQTVTVEWQGVRASFEIANPSDWESGWEYVAISDKVAKLTGFTDFNNGHAVKTLYLPERIGQYEIVELAGASKGYTIFDYADKTSYEEVVLPVTLNEISGSQAFRNFSALKKVTSLAPVLRMAGNNIFSYNESLAEVVGAVELVGGSTFAGDTALRKVTLSGGMTELPVNSFSGCSSLEEMILPEDVTKIGEYAFAGTSLEKVYVPSGVTEIGERAFTGKTGDITIWTNAESYAKTYAVENRIPYEATNVSDVELAMGETSFKAFDVVKTDVYVYFDRGVNDGEYRELKGVAGRRETVDASEVEVVYQNGGEGFRYGDDSFVVRGLTQYGEQFEKAFAATVVKVEFGEVAVLNGDKLVVRDNDFKAMKDRIITYAASTEYKHYNKNNEVATTDVLKTGDIIKVVLNGTQVYEYRVALLGDTSGDGKVSYLDYVNVYNHIQKVKHPESGKVLLVDEYLLAADLSGDGKVNYLDYVQVYNKIKEQKRG